MHALTYIKRKYATSRTSFFNSHSNSLQMGWHHLFHRKLHFTFTTPAQGEPPPPLYSHPFTDGGNQQLTHAGFNDLITNLKAQPPEIFALLETLWCNQISLRRVKRWKLSLSLSTKKWPLSKVIVSYCIHPFHIWSIFHVMETRKGREADIKSFLQINRRR